MSKAKKSVAIYIGNVFCSGNQFVWAIIAFKMFPRIDTAQADPQTMTINRAVWNDISNRVLDRMKNEHITYKLFYLDDGFDCVEFARCFVDYFCQEMRKLELSVAGKGIPIDAKSFIEKKRGGHCCIKVKIDGKIEYYEPYPDYFRKLDLDREEIATMRPVVTI
jgi:hypothetical protein